MTGSKTVVDAVAGAKRVAAAMLDYLDGKATTMANDAAGEPPHHVHGTVDL